MQNQNNSTEKANHFIGLGSAGSNMLEYIHNKGIKAHYTIITEPKRPNLNSEINFIEFSPKCKMRQLRNVKYRIPELLLNLYIPKQVVDLFSTDVNFILLSGLSGVTGTNLTKELTCFLEKRNKSFHTICTLPFQFEGKNRISLANEVFKVLQTYSNFHFLDLETIRNKYGNLTVNEAFEKANEEIFFKISNLPIL